MKKGAKPAMKAQQRRK